MPLPRFQRLAPEKRAQLLRFAAEEFAEKGNERASLNEILAAAGLGKSSYYYYFADKEDLYATVIEDAFGRLAAELPPLSSEGLDAKGYWAAIEKWIALWTRVVSRDRVAMALIVDFQRIRRTPNPRFLQIFENIRAQYRAFLEAGRALGCVRTDLGVDELVALSEAADAALDEALLARRDYPNAAALEAHADLALDTARRLLAPVKAETKAKAKAKARAPARRAKAR